MFKILHGLAPDYQISLQRPTQSIDIVISEIQLKRSPFLYLKEIS